MSNIEELQLAIERVFSIECVGCGERAEALGATSAVGAAKVVDEWGWKVIDGEAACPGCQRTETYVTGG